MSNVRDPFAVEARIRREVAEGVARHGLSCCGTTAVNHRWFCLGSPPAARDEPPDDIDAWGVGDV